MSAVIWLAVWAANHVSMVRSTHADDDFDHVLRLAASRALSESIKWKEAETVKHLFAV